MSVNTGSPSIVQTPKPTRSFHVAWYPSQAHAKPINTSRAESQSPRCTDTDSSRLSTPYSSSSYAGHLDNDSQSSRTSSPDDTQGSMASGSQSGDQEGTIALLKYPKEIYFDVPTSRPLQKRKWVQAMRNAALIEDTFIRERNLNAAVRSTDVWTDEEMIELTRQFVWGASEPGRPNINDHFATLADTLRDAFARFRPHEHLGDRFSWHLKTSSITTFEQCWNDENHRAIGSFDTFPRKGLSRQLSCALAHCKFLGSLYRKNFLDRTEVAYCVGILLKFTTTLEHLTALSNLLFQAGTQLWRDCTDRQTEINTLRKAVVEAAKGIVCDRALFINALALKTTKATVAHILSQLDQYLKYFDPNYTSQYIVIKP